MTVLSIEELKEVVPDPKWTVKELDKYIIGQDAAKRTLALMMFNRALLILKQQNKIETDFIIPKNNVMLIGPSGTGKTALMRSLAKVFDIPITIFDVTCITANGYIGADVEDILHTHINNNHTYWYNNIDKVFPKEMVTENTELNQKLKDDVLNCCINNGIIYLDEIDKVCIRNSNGIDINGEMVQNALLKYLEGGIVRIDMNSSNPENSKKNTLKKTSVDTSNIFFVCGGAFSGLHTVINDRIRGDSGIGFMSKDIFNKREQNDRIMKNIQSEDIIKYGFKKEFIGRIPLITYLNDLTVDDLIKIIKEPKDSVLQQYAQMFKVLGIDLEVEEDGFKYIAEKTLDLKMGARALKATFSKLLEDYLYSIFDISDNKLVVTKEEIERRLK